MDVKFWPQSWSSYWHHFEDSKIYLLGQPEIEWGVGPPGPLEATAVLNNHKDDPVSTLMDTRNGKWWSVANSDYRNLIANTGWIARPKTPVFKEVVEFNNQVLPQITIFFALGKGVDLSFSAVETKNLEFTSP